MTGLKRFLFLPGNARFADLGLLLLRIATGAFLIYQSHDNVLSAARMDEFVKLLTQFKFVMPEIMAPLSVYAQFAAGALSEFSFSSRTPGSSCCAARSNIGAMARHGPHQGAQTSTSTGISLWARWRSNAGSSTSIGWPLKIG